MENQNEIKVAVLEQRIDDFSSIVTKLDAAIEKLSEVNSNVGRMLAVHEERITKQEEIDTVLFDKIDKLRDKMDRDHVDVSQRIQILERKLWAALAALGVLMVSTNPGTIRLLKPLLTSDSDAILRPVATLMHGSN
jgi:uncharacterized coiled-coil protein SlyX